MNGRPRRAWARAVRLVAVIALAAVLVPDAGRQPVSMSLTASQAAKEMDFAEGVVWILVLGSDARPGEELFSGNSDAIHLVGLDLASGRAADLGIPRDTWLDLPGHGFHRINEAMSLENPDFTARVVGDLVGIAPAYVFVSGFEGFTDMVDTIGGVQVTSDEAFTDEEFGLEVRKGVNDFDGTEALDYARTRAQPTGDYARSANQQQMMLGILDQLRAREDEEGFLESGTYSALSGLVTDLAPTELYRLAQAITLIEPGRVQTCVLTGDDLVTEGGAQVVELDPAVVRRIGTDVRDDLRYDDGC